VQATTSCMRTQGRNSGTFHQGGSRTPWGTPRSASTSLPSKVRLSSPQRQVVRGICRRTRAPAPPDRPLRLLIRHLVGGAAKRPAAPAKANNDRCGRHRLLHLAANASAIAGPSLDQGQVIEKLGANRSDTSELRGPAPAMRGPLTDRCGRCAVTFFVIVVVSSEFRHLRLLA
jgi:hypothetical protein